MTDDNTTTCWAVCALNYDRDGAPILAVSENAEDYDLTVGYDAIFDYDKSWVGDNPPGLYLLTFRCTDESWVEEVLEVERLVLFPSLATMAADQHQAIARRMREIQEGR